MNNIQLQGQDLNKVLELSTKSSPSVPNWLRSPLYS